MWHRVSNLPVEEDDLSLEELHRKAYESIDRSDNYNYDNEVDTPEENEFSIFPENKRGR